MKKTTLTMAAVVAMAMTACTGKQKPAETATDTQQTFEEQQIKAGMNMQLDSLTNIWLGLQQRGLFGIDESGKPTLSAEQKKVLPDYLFTPESLAGKTETLSAMYRAFTVFSIDKEVAALYDMKDVWTPAIEKLTSEMNDPALKLTLKGDIKYTKDNFEELNKKLYKLEEENGRANHFWESAATSIVEQTYLLSVNQDILLSKMTDKDAEDITYRIVLLLDAFEELSEYNPQLLQMLNVLQPLGKLNAISVDQLRQQLNETKEEVAASRAKLFDFE